MFLRGNSPVLNKNPAPQREPKQKKIQRFIIPGLFVLLLAFAGIYAITQEADEDGLDEDLPAIPFSEYLEEEWEGEPEPEWIPPGPPRWFRSNAGGMTLEEIPSRLAALRNQYALVIDYVPPDELEPRLLPYYHDGYTVEIRILFVEQEMSRRQWLFRDSSGVARLNAVLVPPPVDEADDPGMADEQGTDEVMHNEAVDGETKAPAVAGSHDESPAAIGFIELYNEKAQIIADLRLFDDGSEIIVTYVYKGNILIRAETQHKTSGSYYQKMFTDEYRYNRSYSLRHVERLYHGEVQAESVRIVFPGRVLEAAADFEFFNEKLSLSSDFLDSYSAGEGYRMLYDTDSRGRILAQTMIDDKDEEVWVIKNSWSGDRITSILKVEGDNEKLTEYEYDSAGTRIVQRDIQNGALERQVYFEGENETEELYLNGILVLKAYWENGRKISEERVRRR